MEVGRKQVLSFPPSGGRVGRIGSGRAGEDGGKVGYLSMQVGRLLCASAVTYRSGRIC